MGCAAVVGIVQRRLYATCHAVALVGAAALATPATLPWLMAASAAITTVAAAMFATFAGMEWPQSDSLPAELGGGCGAPSQCARSTPQMAVQGSHVAAPCREEAETARLISS